MKTKLLFIIILGLTIKTNAQTPDWAWATSNGGSDYEWGQSIATDAMGNTIVAGAFYSSSITFGSTVLTNPNSGKFNSFIVKYDANGNVTWAKGAIAIGGWNYNRATGVAIDKLNYIYVTGIYYSSTINIGGVTLTNNSCCLGATYILKFTPAGNIVWAKTTSGVASNGVPYPPQPFYEPSVNKIAINKNNGDFFITGTFDSLTMTFGSTILTNVVNPVQYPNTDIFIAKFDSSGNFVWAKSIGGGKLDYISDIAIYNSNIYLTGYFSSDTLNIGSTTLLNPNQSSTWNNTEVFVAKYDTSGNPLWANQGESTLTGILRNKGKSITADASGNCYITGEFESHYIVFDNDTLFNTDTVSGSSKVFVVKYNSSGNVMWTKNFANGLGNDFAMGIQTDATGNVYVGGNFFSYAISFDGIVLTSWGNGIFITKLNPSGNVYWAKAPDGPNDYKYLVGLSVNTAGNVYITGEFETSIYFGNDTLTSNGQSDIYTAKILNCSSRFSVYPTSILHNWVAVNQATGLSPITYTWDWGDGTSTSSGPAPSHTYTVSGYYNICLTINANGCSSTYCDSSTYIYRSTNENAIININVVVLGINEKQNNQLDFSIFPNPTVNFFTLTTNTPLTNPQITIYNTLGETIYSEKLKSSTSNFSKQINLNAPAGIYFVQVSDGEKEYTGKLVVE